MTAQSKPVRIVGCLARLKGPVAVEPWKPLTPAAAQALPPLPRPRPRGWQVTAAAPPVAAAPPEALANPPATAPEPASVPPQQPNAWERLGQAPAQQIAPMLAHEHPQTLALILSQLEPAKAAGILHHLPEGLQADVAYRIATMENVPPATFDTLRASLELGLRAILGSDLEAGGPKVLADLLNLSGASTEKRVLEQMDAQKPEIAEAVRNLMFVFADIARMTDHDIQVLLREVDQKDLVMALKGAGEELTERFLSNMSAQVRTFITEEMQFIGSVRQSEVDETRLRIVQQVRQLEERGQVKIVRGAEDLLV
ncbi:MAG: hypothetical protein IT369_24450 [Candidatus Latescibacteria bacterium]|nr:hypothetical protein [Candidatus Latescibacterota bacterium]